MFIESVATQEPPGHIEGRSGSGAKRALAQLDFEAQWENIAPEENADRQDEVELYLNLKQPNGSNDRDLLSWWKAQEATLPCLSRLARSVLSVPASSSSRERAFSVAGRTLEKRRNQLKPATVDAMIFLNSYGKN